MKEEPTYTSLMDYLTKTGVLARNNSDEIATAKKEYRRYYLRQYKREQRGNRRELVLSIPKDFHGQLNREATRHGLTAPRLVLEIIKGHFNAVPVIHHPDLFAQFEVSVAQLHSELTFMADQLHDHAIQPDLQQLIQRIAAIEQAVLYASQCIRLEDFLRIELNANPTLRPKLIELLQQLIAEK